MEYLIQDSTLSAMADQFRLYTDEVGNGTHIFDSQFIYRIEEDNEVGNIYYFNRESVSILFREDIDDDYFEKQNYFNDYYIDYGQYKLNNKY